jgi:hypothetical protein
LAFSTTVFALTGVPRGFLTVFAVFTDFVAVFFFIAFFAMSSPYVQQMYEHRIP